MTDACTRPPSIWKCSRPADHDGPCAARAAGRRETIVGCARCYGEGHTDLLFEPLTHPVDVNDDLGPLTHWAPCPTNGEPILLRTVPEDTPPLKHEEIAS